MTQGRFERLLQAWLVPRCTTVSPAVELHLLGVEHQRDLAVQHQAEIERARLLHVGMRRLRGDQVEAAGRPSSAGNMPRPLARSDLAGNVRPAGR